MNDITNDRIGDHIDHVTAAGPYLPYKQARPKAKRREAKRREAKKKNKFAIEINESISTIIDHHPSST